MTPPRVADKEASSNRGNDPANHSGIQTTTPRNVPLRVERTQSRSGKNTTRVDSGEHHKASDVRPRHCGAGFLELHFIFYVHRGGGNMANEGLSDLYIDELKDLYNAENQLVKALPKVAKAASSDELKQGFEEHLEQTRGHVQ
jgi:hypothetical protein